METLVKGATSHQQEELGRPIRKAIPHRRLVVTKPTKPFKLCLFFAHSEICGTTIFSSSVDKVFLWYMRINMIYEKVSYEFKKKGATGQKINYEVNNARNVTKFTTHYLDPSQIKV